MSKGKKVTIYTLRIEGETDSEFEKFVNNKEIKANESFGGLIQHLKDVEERHGFIEKWFKAEIEPVYAFYRGNLRFFCIKWSPIILIFGNGGIKTTRTFQQDPHLNGCVDKLLYVNNRLEKREKEGEIKTNYDLLEGELNF